MKEPGQIAHHAAFTGEPATAPDYWHALSSNSKAMWARVEAACRAAALEEAQEAVRQAWRHGGDQSLTRINDAIRALKTT